MAGTDARHLLLSKSEGVLSTHSLEVPGYPFGSIVPFSLDRQGRPVVLISHIAQHTKNVLANPKVSLIVTQDATADVQAHGRLTILADVEPVEGNVEDVASRYYRRFPQSRGYHQAHSFGFFTLVPFRYRFIGGFGKIHWIEPPDLEQSNPFSADEEAAIADHMNEDHQDAMRHYCALNGLAVGEEPLLFAGLDSEGFELSVSGRRHRFWFERAVATGAEARGELVRWARQPLPS